MLDTFFVQFFACISAAACVAACGMCWLNRRHVREIERDYSRPQCALRLLERCKVISDTITDGVVAAVDATVRTCTKGKTARDRAGEQLIRGRN